MEQLNTNVAIPVEASGNGRRNAFVLHCDVMMHAKQYAVCLNICAKMDAGTPLSLYGDCIQASRANTCAARRMRAHELKEGHAVYFRERETMAVAEAPRSEFVTPAKSPVTNTAKPEPVTSVVRATPVSTGGYADAINRALAAHTAKSESKPGESLLEMAKRLINTK